MFKDARKKVDSKKLQKQVSGEYEYTLPIINTKRDIFRDRIKRYGNIQEQSDELKVRAHYTYAVIDTLHAMRVNDKPTVKFRGRNIDDDERARQLNKLYEFDYEECNIAEIDYKSSRDALFFGVGIYGRVGRDSDKKAPIARRFNPLTAIIDPDAYITGHRYLGFEVMENIENLGYDKMYFNLDKITYKEENSETQQTRDAYQQERYIQQDYGLGIVDSPMFDCYHHFVCFKGKKYLTSWANNRNLLIRCMEIVAENKEEERNPSLINFPISLEFVKPLEHDPFGMSIPDFTEDIDQAMQLFYNLQIQKAQFSAYGDKFLVDKNAVNKNDLIVQTNGTTYIDYDGSINPEPVREIRTPSFTQEEYNMPNIIKGIGMSALGLDNQTLGGAGDRNITATENQRVQANSNLRQILINKVGNIAKRQFARQRYRMYLLNIKTSSKKTIRVTNAIGTSFIEFGKRDMPGVANVDIIVESEMENEENKEKRKMALMTVGMQALEYTQSEYSKNQLLREMMKINGIEEDEAMQYIPPSIDEMQAKQDLILLNRDKDVGDITDMNQDHWTYIQIYSRSQPTDAREKAIRRRMDAYVKSGQKAQQQEQQAQQQPGGGVANQLTNAAIQEATPQQQGALSNLGS